MHLQTQSTRRDEGIKLLVQGSGCHGHSNFHRDVPVFGKIQISKMGRRAACVSVRIPPKSISFYYTTNLLQEPEWVYFRVPSSPSLFSTTMVLVLLMYCCAGHSCNANDFVFPPFQSKLARLSIRSIIRTVHHGMSVVHCLLLSIIVTHLPVNLFE